MMVFLDGRPVNKPEVMIGAAQTKFVDGKFTDEVGAKLLADLGASLALAVRQAKARRLRVNVTQNIYDNDGFFAGYSQLPALRRRSRRRAGVADAPGDAAAMLGGKRVVDLGCGFGWFCRFAREAGAAEVLGLDVSEQHAGAGARDDAGRRRSPTEQADLETLDLPAGSFDLAYSSLTLHYLENLGALFADGPSRAGARRPLRLLGRASDLYRARPPGWSDKTWPLDRYLDEGPRTTDWLAKGVIKQHRTLGDLSQPADRGGLHPRRASRNGARPTQQIAAHPEWKIERQRPAVSSGAAAAPLGGLRPSRARAARPWPAGARAAGAGSGTTVEQQHRPGRA